MLICRPWITVGGKRIYARDRGLQAFCFEVDEVKTSIPKRPADPDDPQQPLV